jgi:hypothetical protein
MTNRLPQLCMDGVLCDRPQDGCFISGKRNYARDNISNTTKKETTKMKTLSADQLIHYIGIRNPAAADRYWARCMGQDSAIDDETAARIKEFLSDKLSDKDHTKLCSMLDGDGEAQDEPSPDDVETFNTGDNPPPLPGTPRPMGGMDGLSARQRMQAADRMLAKRVQARDDFFARFPDAAKINIDSSGIQPSRRGASYSAADAASFAAMFPDASRIRLA